MQQTPKERVQHYHSLIRTIRNDIYQILGRRLTNDDIRFCLWNGQSDDGRKHEIDLGDKALPFEGASDARIRTVDKIINENVKELVLAATRVSPKVKGERGDDDNKAGKIGALIKWLKDNKWGTDFREQIELLAQYVEGDTPAAAIMWVDWVEEKAIGNEEVDSDGLITLLTKSMGEEMTDDVLVDIIKMINDPDREGELVALIRKQWPNISVATGKKIATDIRNGEKTMVPVPYLRKNMPVVKARRLFDDIFVRTNLREWARVPEIIHREWLSEHEIRERAKTEEWSDDFVAALLGEEVNDEGFQGLSGQEGRSAWDDTSFYLASKTTRLVDTEPRRMLWEINTIYEYKTDDDGNMCIWKTIFSGYVDYPAKKSEKFVRKHGGMPFVMFTREAVRARKLDTRGVAELGQTHQNMQKLVHDAFADHVQVMTNPPLKVLQGRVKFQVALAPFGQLEQGPREDVKFLERPPFPEAARWMIEKLDKDIDEFFGRPNKELDPKLSMLHSQDRVDRFLSGMKEVYMLVIQLCQEFMTDEMLEEVIGKDGLPIARTMDEIQGKYHLTLSFDVRDLNMDFIKEKAQLYLNVIKQLDTQATVQWDHCVKRLMDAIDPFDSDAMVLDSGTASEKEIDDEKLNYAKMLAGVEPKMTDGAINAQARLQVIQEENQKRMQYPQAFGPVSPAASSIISNRMKYLQFQIQQQENAKIGRMGTEPLQPQDMAGKQSVTRQPPELTQGNPQQPQQPQMPMMAGGMQ